MAASKYEEAPRYIRPYDQSSLDLQQNLLLRVAQIRVDLKEPH